MTHSKRVSTTKSGYLRTPITCISINMEILFLSLKVLHWIVHMIACFKQFTLMLNLLTILLVCEIATVNSEVTTFFLIKLLHFKRTLLCWDKVQIFDRSAQGSFVSFSYSITYWQFLKQLYSALKRQSLPSLSTLLNSMWTINSKVSSHPSIMYLSTNSTGQCNYEILSICCIQTTHIISLWKTLKFPEMLKAQSFFAPQKSVWCSQFVNWLN